MKGSAGIWEGFIPHVGVGEVYKYFINSTTGEDLEKSDPFALYKNCCRAPVLL